MKKKELKRRLATTQEWLEKFQSDAAAETVTRMIVQQKLDKAIEQNAELSSLLDRPFVCPWCFSDDTKRFKTASDLRLHEQSCTGNRNAWKPDVIPAGFHEILAVLNMSTPPGMQPHEMIYSVIHEIKTLIHRSRPICIFCGASTKTIDDMRGHVGAEHGVNWLTTPVRADLPRF